MPTAKLDREIFLEETVGKVRLSQDSEGALGEGRARGTFRELAFDVFVWPSFIGSWFSESFFLAPTTFKLVKLLGFSLESRT
jgi:hypothetical protein